MHERLLFTISIDVIISDQWVRHGGQEVPGSMDG